MKFLERRIPNEKSESQNSFLLDGILVMIGFIISFEFNYQIRSGLLDGRFIYFNGVIIVGMLLMFLITRIQKKMRGNPSRLLYSCVTLQMGWGLAVTLFDFFVKK